MQRSVSSPGRASVIPPPQVPQVSYDTSINQYLNVNGSRPSPLLTSTTPPIMTTTPARYAYPTVRPQDWFQMATGQQIHLNEFLARYPMNVALPEPIVSHMQGNGPTPSPSLLQGWLSHARVQSRNVVPLANPQIAHSSMISNIEYIDNTDFSKVPWTQMDAKYALPEPGSLSAHNVVYNPDPYGNVGSYLGIGM